MYHVYGHQDWYLQYNQLDETAQVNVDANHIADEDLVTSVALNLFLQGPLWFA